MWHDWGISSADARYPRLDTDRNDENVDHEPLTRRVATDLAPLLITAERAIEVQIDGALSIHGDADAFEPVMTNLVQNEIEHGGRHVILRVLASGFEVEDHGPGMPPEERERVFELRRLGASEALSRHCDSSSQTSRPSFQALRRKYLQVDFFVAERINLR